MCRDFTLDKYRELCQAVINSGYQVLTVSRYLENQNVSPQLVILRHDVDRSPGNALRMAGMERELNIVATYYFRKRRHTFKPEIIRSIALMGHEIGYHYEALVKARGDYERAIQVFEDELNEFRQICDVKTISMHGSPLSKYDNRDLWQKYDFRKFGIIGEAYLSVDYDKVAYLTDTGRAWDAQRYNLRDRVGSDSNLPVSVTDDLITIIRRHEVDQLCIQTHPNRWPTNRLAWGISAVEDWAVNQAKRAISLTRSQSG